MRVSTWSDSLLFIPIYALFLIFTFLGLRGRDPFLANIGIFVVIVLALADYAENTCLLQIIANPDVPSPALTWLHYATSTKWLGLGVAAFIGGLILGQAGGLANNLAFVVMAASLAAGVIDRRQSSLVTLVVALSMVSTPLLLLVHRRLVLPLTRRELG